MSACRNLTGNYPCEAHEKGSLGPFIVYLYELQQPRNSLPHTSSYPPILSPHKNKIHPGWHRPPRRQRRARSGQTSHSIPPTPLTFSSQLLRATGLMVGCHAQAPAQRRPGLGRQGNLALLSLTHTLSLSLALSLPPSLPLPPSFGVFYQRFRYGTISSHRLSRTQKYIDTTSASEVVPAFYLSIF